MVHRGQGAAGSQASEDAALGPEKKTSGIVQEFETLFAQTRPAFSQDRVFQRARRLAISSMAALGRRTISGMLCTGAQQFEDWSAAYRLFEKERIDREALFAPARNAVVEKCPADKPLVVMMDDTLVRKRGRKVHGTGWKRDPLGPHFCTNFVWGQRFLQLSAALPDEACPGRARGIPIDFIHAPSAAKPRKKAPPEEWEEYRRQQKRTKVSGVAAVRLEELRRQVRDKRIVCAVDGGFTNRTMFRNPPKDVTLIGRIRKDARLFAPPEEEKAPRRGRRRWYGTALPTPEEARQNDAIAWRKVEAFASGTRHQFEVKVMPAVRWVGTGDRTVQVVVVRPLAYRPRKGAKLLYRNPAYLLCTDPDLSLEDVLQAYLWRWEIELNFKEEKTTVGVGEAQVRTPAAVEAVPALVVASYAFLLLAGARTTGEASLPRPKWQTPRQNERWTTPQMLGLFRSQLWKIAVDANLTHFADKNHAKRTQFYSGNALNSAVCYAIK